MIKCILAVEGSCRPRGSRAAINKHRQGPEKGMERRRTWVSHSQPRGPKAPWEQRPAAIPDLIPPPSLPSSLLPTHNPVEEAGSESWHNLFSLASCLTDFHRGWTDVGRNTVKGIHFKWHLLGVGTLGVSPLASPAPGSDSISARMPSISRKSSFLVSALFFITCAALGK